MVTKRTDVFTRLLAIIGTLFVSVPILAPLVLGVLRMGSGRPVLIDWLMPAELFPLVLLGGALLLVAAFRAHARRKSVGFGLIGAVVFLVGAQALAVVTGLANGETEPEGIALALVIGLIALYSAAVLELAVTGVLLVRDAFGHRAAELSGGVPA